MVSKLRIKLKLEGESKGEINYTPSMSALNYGLSTNTPIYLITTVPLTRSIVDTVLRKNGAVKTDYKNRARAFLIPQYVNEMLKLATEKKAPKLNDKKIIKDNIDLILSFFFHSNVPLIADNRTYRVQSHLLTDTSKCTDPHKLSRKLSLNQSLKRSLKRKSSATKGGAPTKKKSPFKALSWHPSTYTNTPSSISPSAAWAKQSSSKPSRASPKTVSPQIKDVCEVVVEVFVTQGLAPPRPLRKATVGCRSRRARLRKTFKNIMNFDIGEDKAIGDHQRVTPPMHSSRGVTLKRNKRSLILPSIGSLRNLSQYSHLTRNPYGTPVTGYSRLYQPRPKSSYKPMTLNTRWSSGGARKTRRKH
jgi:hypothetical protein